MTLVCSWIDQSYGSHRITAIADARATDRVDEKVVVRTDMTVKLFRVTVRCYHEDNFDRSVGKWCEPYAECELGMGFAGYCFEAMAIIALFSRAMEQLITPDQNRPLPRPKNIVAILEQIVGQFFAGHHNREAQRVDLMLFGFANEEPWIARVAHYPDRGVVTELSRPMNNDRIYTIGDAGGVAFEEGVEEVRVRIRKHRAEIADNFTEDKFECDLQMARHNDADKKHIEEEALRKIESEYQDSVGGYLQKLEVYPLEAGGAVSYTRDTRSNVLSDLPEAGPNLGYMPVGERLGR